MNSDDVTSAKNAIKGLMKETLGSLVREQDLDQAADRIAQSTEWRPVAPLVRNEEGKLVLLLSPTEILGLTADILRKADFLVPENIPGCAVLQRRDGVVGFGWSPFEAAKYETETE